VSLPTLLFELALTTLPADTAVWEDETASLRGFSIRRGRQHELDKFDAGIATFELDNRDRRFDPTFSGEITNLIDNPSFEVNTTGWATFIGAASFARVAEPTAPSGGYVLEQTYNGTDLAFGQSTTVSGLIPGETYTVSAYVRRVSGTGRLEIDVEESGILDTNGLGSYDPAAGGPWVRVSDTFVYPLGGSGTVNVRPHSFSPSAGVAQWDAIQLERASAVSAYIDGSLDNGRWAGTAHASQSYRGGPYYPYVLPMRRCRLSAVWDGVTYPLYTGYVTDWGQAWPRTRDATASVRAVDGFKILALKELNTSYSQEASDVRIGHVLDSVGWSTGDSWVVGVSELDTETIVGPGGDREIGTGSTTVQASTLAGVSGLAHLQLVELTEGGAFWLGPDGAAKFIGRQRLSQPPYSESQATFGDDLDAGELPYHDLNLAYDDAQIWNEILFTRNGGSQQSASDTTSQDNFYPRTLERSGLLFTADGEALTAATFALGRYKDPHLRITALDLTPQRDDRLWPLVLGLDLNQLVTVNRRPEAGGDAISQASRIEGIDHAWRPGQWRTRWALTGAEGDMMWFLGEETSSALGTGTRLGY
jgi:hypothetical protein